MDLRVKERDSRMFLWGLWRMNQRPLLWFEVEWPMTFREYEQQNRNKPELLRAFRDSLERQLKRPVRGDDIIKWANDTEYLGFLIRPGKGLVLDPVKIQPETADDRTCQFMELTFLEVSGGLWADGVITRPQRRICFLRFEEK